MRTECKCDTMLINEKGIVVFNQVNLTQKTNLRTCFKPPVFNPAGHPELLNLFNVNFLQRLKCETRCVFFFYNRFLL